MITKTRVALRAGATGAFIGLLLVFFETYRVEQHNYHVLGYHAWPDISSAIGLVVFTLAVSFIGFATFFLVSLVVVALLPSRVA